MAMKEKSRYFYEKRIRELEDQIVKYGDDRFHYKAACSEIYEGIIDILKKGSINTPTTWILEILRRNWR